LGLVCPEADVELVSAADCKLLIILARMLNQFGDEGRNAIPTFTAANFELTTATAGAVHLFNDGVRGLNRRLLVSCATKASSRPTGPFCAGPLTAITATNPINEARPVMASLVF
jgi:hypothetical protein